MAKVTGLNLRDDTRIALDEFAKMLGVNRSIAADMILRAALDVDSQELTEAMTKVLRIKGKEEAAQAVDTAING